MTRWYEPTCASDWLKRSLSLPNLTVVIITALILVSELRFDWCEAMIGRYLSVTNSRRPEIGAVWQAGARAARARTTLDARIADLKNAATQSRDITSLAALVEIIPEGKWILLENEVFANLYFSLPQAAADDIMTGAELLWLYKSGHLRRIFAGRTDDALEIFFLDSENRVIRSLALDNRRIDLVEKGQPATAGRLESVQEFSGRIYTADLFFQALFSLPGEMIPDLIPFPEVLTREPGTIVRAGIGNEASSGYIRLGFEFDNDGRTRLLFIRAREWAVWRLGMVLAGGGS